MQVEQPVRGSRRTVFLRADPGALDALDAGQLAGQRDLFGIPGLEGARAAAVSGGLIAMLFDGLDAVRTNDLTTALSAVGANGLVMGLLVAVVSAVVVGGLHSAWPPFAISRAWLTVRGPLPRRFMAFLADAHRFQLLRHTGPADQFRHVEFQRRLAQRYVP